MILAKRGNRRATAHPLMSVFVMSRVTVIVAIILAAGIALVPKHNKELSPELQAKFDIIESYELRSGPGIEHPHKIN